jgi:hypothetical protein
MGRSMIEVGGIWLANIGNLVGGNQSRVEIVWSTFCDLLAHNGKYDYSGTRSPPVHCIF